MPGCVWLHAVSVGEVLSAAVLIRALREALPGVALYLSTTTLAGREVAEKNLDVPIFYAPFDFPWAVRRVLRRLRPRLVIVLETEIWPNLWNESRRCGAGLLIVNGRISDRAWPRYRVLRPLFRPVLQLPHRILAQSERDAARYRELGASAEAAGNLKYDFEPRDAAAAAELHSWLTGASAVWVAASTMPPDEDDAVLDAWERVRRPGVRLLLVPRKPEMFDVAAAKLTARGLPFVCRSSMSGSGDILLLDTVGELAALYRYATVVFIGGTLVPSGGHNLLEPAAFAKPVIVGPHMENFRDIAGRFEAADALIRIADRGALAEAVRRGLTGEYEAVGERARATAEAERGATRRAAGAAVELHRSAVPHVLPYGPIHPVLWLLSRLWIAGGNLRRRWTRPVRLPAPVISVGGIAMGGSGKTPLVRALAAELRSRGLQPAILTRGYRRERGGAVTIVRAGESAPVEVTGDEAQLFVRDGFAHVGIGADRARVGRELCELLHPDVFLLDDGFQHARLERDLDVVVLDDLDPHAGGEVFPLGRLREPVTALQRAGIVVRKQLAIVALDLPAGTRVAAFCAIGNPASFWRTLDELGLDVVRRRAFPDHHAYSEGDLRELCEPGVEALVTTEKDSVKVGNPPPHLRVVRVEFDHAVVGRVADAFLER